jgi:hypothetical protein
MDDSSLKYLIAVLYMSSSMAIMIIFTRLATGTRKTISDKYTFSGNGNLGHFFIPKIIVDFRTDLHK